MGQQFSIETLTSTDETDGYKYWSSFEPYPYDVGKNKLSYIGVLNGEGPRKGEKCVVKACRNGFGTYTEWNNEITKAKKANEMARKFNKEMTRMNLPGRISFSTPMLVEIDEVSSFMCVSLLLGKPRKKMREFEIVSIEPFLDGNYEEYSSNSVQQSGNIIPEAFSHFSWCKSKGEFIVCNLQGVRKQCLYQFTAPYLHSVDGRYGKFDNGRLGIDNFFSKHRCNNLCRNLSKPGQTMYKYNTFTKQQTDFDIMSMKLDESENKDIEQPELNEESVYILQNYPIRVSSEQTRLLPHPCACAYFRIPCPHRGNSSFIYAPSAPEESTINGEYV